MTGKDHYCIDRERTTTIKIKRSIFICTLAPVTTLDGAKTFISRISRENKTATHNCWAYVLGEGGEICHSSDAGEPPGTAGKPMLNTLKQYDATDIAAVVTRHFGGVRLGVRGLIDAYSESVRQTLDLAPLKKRVRTLCLTVETEYGFNDTLVNTLRSWKADILETAYTHVVVHRIAIEEKVWAGFEILLSEYASQGRLRFEVVPDGPVNPQSPVKDS